MSRRAAALPLSAILLIVASTLCFAVLDSSIKYLSRSYPVLVLVFARWAIQVVVLLAWLGPQVGRGLVRTPSPWLQLARGLLLCGSSVCFMSALKFLPLADATALNYSSPVIVTVMAVLFLREQLSPGRVAFIACGIVGMLLIVRPGTDVFQGAALLAAGAAFLYSTFQILTRQLAGEDWRAMLFIPALVATVLMAILMPFVDWPAHVDLPHGMLLVGASLVGTLGHFLFLRAFQGGTASGLSPFTYSQLVWATLIGWLVFGTFPDGYTLLGMAIIAGSGLFLAWYESLLARRRLLEAATQQPAAVD